MTDWYSVSVDTLRGWGIFIVRGGAGGGRLRRLSASGSATPSSATPVAVVDESRVLHPAPAHASPGWPTSAPSTTAPGRRCSRRAPTSAAREYPHGARRRPAQPARWCSSVLDALRHKRGGGRGAVHDRAGRRRVPARRGRRVGGGARPRRAALRRLRQDQRQRLGRDHVRRRHALHRAAEHPLPGDPHPQRRPASAASRRSACEYGWVNLSTAQNAEPGRDAGGRGAGAPSSRRAAWPTTRRPPQTRFAALRGRMEVISGDSTAPAEPAAAGGAGRRRPALRPARPARAAAGRRAGRQPRGQPRSHARAALRLGAGRRAPRATPSRCRAAGCSSTTSSTSPIAPRPVLPSACRARAASSGAWPRSAREGAQGPWSAPRRLRVASLRGTGSDGDRTPPVLELDDVKSYGAIFIFAGHTEPGSTVEVNGEAVAVAADGTFTKTIQLDGRGLELRRAQGARRLGQRDGAPAESLRGELVALDYLRSTGREPLNTCRCLRCCAISRTISPSISAPPTRWSSRATRASWCASRRWW